MLLARSLFFVEITMQLLYLFMRLLELKLNTESPLGYPLMALHIMEHL